MGLVIIYAVKFNQKFKYNKETYLSKVQLKHDKIIVLQIDFAPLRILKLVQKSHGTRSPEFNNPRLTHKHPTSSLEPQYKN